MRKSVTQGEGGCDAGRGRVWAWGRAREGVRQGEGEFASAPTAEGAAAICTHKIITLSHREMRSTQACEYLAAADTLVGARIEICARSPSRRTLLAEQRPLRLKGSPGNPLRYGTGATYLRNGLT